MAVFRVEVAAMITGKRPRKPVPYKRPRKDDKKKVGKGALLKDDLRRWIDSKMKGSERRG